MAGPYDKFEEAFEKFQTQLRDEIKDALSALTQGTIQAQAPPPFLDLDEFREQLLGEVRDELRVFKEELLMDLKQQLTPPPTASPQQQVIQPTSPAKKTLKDWW